ncbi:hypothetical protein B1748_09020 [Paenibacillus sp. MY03]|uniref:S-layer homology domain-containing protein n=1 Tax=Paenibacillus sp. MY03 TaxID=302980 RepID=UPI000B3C0C7E|nr:S-layer homology domain-containing protein [Paenibacillus sp. MY03]OUS77273.1 hypothetical protein B1748_09020 [Paenibacillus sp. MY03]
MNYKACMIAVCMLFAFIPNKAHGSSEHYWVVEQVIQEQFEDVEVGMLPTSWSKVQGAQSSVAVTNDPADADNQLLLIERNRIDDSRLESRLRIPVEHSQADKWVVSLKLKLESSLIGPQFYNSIGVNGVQWVISGQENGFQLSSRQSNAGVGENFGPLLPYGEWHDLIIEYEPAGREDTSIHYYINGELALVTSGFFGKGSAGVEPDRMISKLSFDNFNTAGSLQLYIDDLQVTANKQVDQELQSLLQRADALISEDVYNWLVSVYDPQRGGFYHSISARDNMEFIPDLESTHFAFEMLVDVGIVPKGEIPAHFLSEEITGPLVQSILQMQDPADGYFYHPHWKKAITESRKNRDLTAATSLLRRFGVEPLYTLPQDRIANQAGVQSSSTAPEYLQSAEALLTWMNNHWEQSTPYSAGNAFSSAREQIRTAGLLDVAVDFIASKQNPATGMWGEGLGLINSNATMKLQGFFAASNRPFPYIEQMIESMATIILDNGSELRDVVDIWNPLVAINGALNSYETIPAEVREAVDDVIIPLIETALNQIDKFKRTDGGYSYSENNSSSTSQGAYVGYGLEEGDVNATNIATVRLRNSIYQMAGVAPKPLYAGTEFANQFLTKWYNLEPIVKIEKPLGLEEDFENIAPGRLAPGMTRSISGESVIQVAEDPGEATNQILLFDRKALNTNTRLQIPINVGVEPPKIVMSMDIRIESPVTGTQFYNSIGKYGVQWVITGREDGFQLSNRRSGSGVGTSVGNPLSYGEWHHLTIEYVPNGVDNTIIRYYIDHELAMTTSDYYNDGLVSNEPERAIDRIRFDNFNSAGIMKLYLDNLSVKVEELDEDDHVEIILGIDENFEDVTLGQLPDQWTPNVGSGARVEVAGDPLHSDNRVLLFDRNLPESAASSSSRLLIPFKGGTESQKVKVSMKLMLESSSTGPLFYNSIGVNAVQWAITGQENGFLLSNRYSEAGTGEQIGDLLSYGRWYDFSIEYEPDGRQDTIIHYYLDGELIMTTSQYFNSNKPGVEPDSVVNRLRFDNFNSARNLKLYIDDLNVTIGEEEPSYHIEVNVDELNLTIGQSRSLQTVAIFDNGTEIDVTSDAVYTSNRESVATVTDEGVVEGISAGTAEIAINYEQLSIIIPITVTGNVYIAPPLVPLNEQEEDEVTPEVDDPHPSESQSQLNDLEGHWAKAAISNLAQLGVIQGYPDQTFRPDQTMTRAEIITMLSRLFDLGSGEELKHPFLDLNPNHWAYDSIAHAYHMGLIQGITKDRFAPEAMITREQYAVVLMRALKLETVTTPLSFLDTTEISGWALEALRSLVHLGIMEGYPDGKFLPQQAMTRAEAVVVLAGLLEAGRLDVEI